MKIRITAERGVFTGKIYPEAKGAILEVGKEVAEDVGELLVKLGKAEVVEEAKTVVKRVTRRKKAVKGKEHADAELPQDSGSKRADGGGDSVPSPRREAVLPEVPDEPGADLI